MAHAILSASASKQWLNCPPSARLQENIPNPSSVYAAEGTFLHALTEYKIRRDYLHEDVKKPASEFYTEEADQVTDVCYEFVVSEIEKLKNPLILIEEKLDYSHIAPNGFGTGDMVLIGDGVIHVIDYKYGRGVFVEADHNSQMMLYALGALAKYGFIWNIEKVKMTIVQPRLDNISTFECTRTELEAWGESIKPIALLAFEGKGEQKMGEWCKFCRAKPICREFKAEAEFINLDAPPPTVPLEELAEMLPKLNLLSEWIKDVFAYVTAKAIAGVPVKGYKVVEGISKRTYKDEEEAARIAEENGYTDIWDKKLIGIRKMEKLMGKTGFVK